MNRIAIADREKAADGGGFEEWGFDDKVSGRRKTERIGDGGHEWEFLGGVERNLRRRKWVGGGEMGGVGGEMRHCEEEEGEDRGGACVVGFQWWRAG